MHRAAPPISVIPWRGFGLLWIESRSSLRSLWATILRASGALPGRAALRLKLP